MINNDNVNYDIKNVQQMNMIRISNLELANQKIMMRINFVIALGILSLSWYLIASIGKFDIIVLMMIIFVFTSPMLVFVSLCYNQHTNNNEKINYLERKLEN